MLPVLAELVASRWWWGVESRTRVGQELLHRRYPETLSLQPITACDNSGRDEAHRFAIKGHRRKVRRAIGVRAQAGRARAPQRAISCSTSRAAGRDRAGLRIRAGKGIGPVLAQAL